MYLTEVSSRTEYCSISVLQYCSITVQQQCINEGLEAALWNNAVLHYFSIAVLQYNALQYGNNEGVRSYIVK